MKLVPVYGDSNAAGVLYELLDERTVENRISHERMPTYAEHEAFIASHPFRYWYLIEVEGERVGALEVTDLNEIGVAILRRHQRRGYGRAALKLFLATHEPLPPIPAKRNGRWLANIAVSNEGSKAFFRKAGFVPLQETWALCLMETGA